MIIMRRLTTKIRTKEDIVMQWKTQAGNITTNLKVKIFLTIPEFSATKKVTWLFNVDDSTKSKYIIVSGRYI